jgi:hypothetical protein
MHERRKCKESNVNENDNKWKRNRAKIKIRINKSLGKIYDGFFSLNCSKSTEFLTELTN